MRKVSLVRLQMKEMLLSYLTNLSNEVTFPSSLWIEVSADVFSRPRTFTLENYESLLNSKVSEVATVHISTLLEQLFPLYEITPATHAPFPRVVQSLIAHEGIPETQQLLYLSTLRDDLVQNGINSPFFPRIVQRYMFVLTGSE